MQAHPRPLPHSVKILSWNANSLTNKKDELHECMRHHEIDVALIGETFLSIGKKFKIANTDVYRYDRPTAGGGTAILIRRGTEHHEIALPPLASIEANAVMVKTQSGDLRIISAYKPPQKALDTADLDAIFSDPVPTILAGDLNCKHTSWNSRTSNNNGRRLFAHGGSRGYQVLGPVSPTFFSSTQTRPDVLDVTLTNNTKKSIHLQTLQELTSDHNPVCITYGDAIIETTEEPRLNLKKTDWKLFKVLIDRKIPDQTPALESPADVDKHMNQLTSIISSALEESTPPLILQRNIEYDLPPFILKAIAAKNMVRKLWQRHKQRNVKTLLNNLVTGIKRMVAEHRNDQWSKKIGGLNIKDHSLWQLTKRLMKITTKTPPLHGVRGLAYSSQDKANALADTLESTFTPHNDPSCIVKIEEVGRQLRAFHNQPRKTEDADIASTTPAEIRLILTKLKTRKAPGLDGIPNAALKELTNKATVYLAQIVNGILTHSHFPADFKKSKIILFPKPGKDLTFPQNYRPISLLSCISKIVERVILTRLSLHLADKKTLINEQFGFRAKHSSNHQVLRLTEMITKGFNEKRVTAAVFLDVAQAFDRVWHEGLLAKMISMDVPGYLVRLVESYLEDRSFEVHHLTAVSTTRRIEAGVPQGSLLGPTLFSIYVNDMPTSPNVERAIYADDTALVAQSWQGHQACKYLQTALSQLEDWCEAWRIKINVSKSNAVLFTKRRTAKATTTTDLELFDDAIPWVNEARYLGVVLDRTLSWRANIANLASRARSRLGILGPVLNRRSALSVANGLTLYKALVLPIMTFAAPIWGSADKSHLDALQRVQNKALRAATKVPWFVRNDDLHRDAKLSSFRETVRRLAENFYADLRRVPNPLVAGLAQYDADEVLKHKRPKNVLARTLGAPTSTPD